MTVKGSEGGLLGGLLVRLTALVHQLRAHLRSGCCSEAQEACSGAESWVDSRSVWAVPKEGAATPLPPSNPRPWPHILSPKTAWADPLAPLLSWHLLAGFFFFFFCIQFKLMSCLFLEFSI